MNQSQIKKKQSRWTSLFVMAFGNTVDNADGGLINGLFPVIRDALKMDLTGLGVFTSISRFSRMIFGPLWAMAADRWNRKALLFVVTGVWGVWTILAGLATDSTQLLILYTIGSIGTVACEPLTNAIAADLFPVAERGKAFGTIRAMSALALVAFIPIVGLFSHFPEGWRWAMFFMGGMSIFSGILILVFLQDPGRGASEAEHTPEERMEWGQVLRLTKNKTVLLTGVSLLSVTSLILVSFSVTFLVDVRGFSNTEGNFVLGVFAAGFVISSVLAGFVGDWMEKRLPGKGRIVLMQIYLVLYAAMSYVCLQLSWEHWAYYPLFFLFGLIGAIGFSGSVLPMISAVVLPELRATAFGFLFSFVQGAVAAIGSLVVGALADRYGLLPVVFWVTTVPYAANALFWFVFYKVYPDDVKRMQDVLHERAIVTRL